MKNKYFKTTQGRNMEVIVAKATAYSTQATFELFATSTAVIEGEVGVFLMPASNKQKDATIQTAALTAGQKFFVAQKRDGLMHRTRIFTYNEIATVKQAYVAPVKQVTIVGFNGTIGSMNSGTLIPGQSFNIKITETTPLSQPYPSWNFEVVSKTGSTFGRLGTDLIDMINNINSPQNRANGKVINAELLTNGTFTVATVSGGNVGVTNGSSTVTATGHNVVVGDLVRIGGTTGAFAVYRVIAVAANSFELDTTYLGATNAALLIANLGKMTAVTEFGIKLIAVDFYSHFRVSIDGDNKSADIVYTIPYKEGNGTYDQVVENEKEGFVFAGYGTANIAFAADYGQPTSFAASGNTYDYIDLNFLRTMKGTNSSVEMDSKYGVMRIITPTGVAPTPTLNTVFPVL